MEQTGADEVHLADLVYAKGGPGHPVRIVLAVPIDSPASRASELPPGTKISTEYPRITERFFEKLGIDVRVFVSYGATEARVPEIVDAIVDVSETGGTLRAHGMKIIDTLMESDVWLIANRDAHGDPERRAAMGDIVTLVMGAMSARGRVLIKLNVGEDRLRDVLAVLPSMKSPTVSSLSEAGSFAVETVVEKAAVNRLIPRLKGAGATDILELPISKIVP